MCGPGHAQEPSRPSHTVSGHPVPPQAGAGKRSGVGPVGDPGSSPSLRAQGFEDRGQPGSQVKPTCLYQRELSGPHSVSYASRLASLCTCVAGSTLSCLSAATRGRARQFRGPGFTAGQVRTPSPPWVCGPSRWDREEAPLLQAALLPPRGPPQYLGPLRARRSPGWVRNSQACLGAGGATALVTFTGSPGQARRRDPGARRLSLCPRPNSAPAEARAGPEAGGQRASRGPPPPRLAGAF